MGKCTGNSIKYEPATRDSNTRSRMFALLFWTSRWQKWLRMKLEYSFVQCYSFLNLWDGQSRGWKNAWPTTSSRRVNVNISDITGMKVQRPLNVPQNLTAEPDTQATSSPVAPTDAPIGYISLRF